MAFEDRFLSMFHSVKDFPDPLPLQKNTSNINCNYINGDDNNNNNNSNKNINNNSSSSNTVKNVKSEKKFDKNGTIKRRKSFTDKFFKNASGGGTLRLTGINASKLRDMFFGDKPANKESNSEDVFRNSLEVAPEEIYASPCSLPPNIGCLPEYENVDYFIPVSTSSSFISLPKHNGLKSPNAGKLRTFRRNDSPYGTLSKEKLNRSRLQLKESNYSDTDSIYCSSPFSYTVPLSSSQNSSFNPIISPVISSKKESDSNSCNKSSKSPLIMVENRLRETFNYGKVKFRKKEQNEVFTTNNNISSEPEYSIYETVKSRDSFSSFSSESSFENEITDLESNIPSNDIYNHLQKELKLKFNEIKRKSDSSLPRISVENCNGYNNKELHDTLSNLKSGEETIDEQPSICKQNSDSQHESQQLSTANGNSSVRSFESPNQSFKLPYTSGNLELNLSNPIQSFCLKEYPKAELNRMQKFFSTENLPKSDVSHYESNGVAHVNSSKTLSDFHRELMQKCTTLKKKTSNLSRNEINESEQQKNGRKFSVEIKPVPVRPNISSKPKLSRKPDINICPLNSKISEINGINESQIITQTCNRPNKPFKPPHLLEIDQGKAKLQKIEINNNSIVISDNPPRKNELNFSSLKRKEKNDFRHLSNLNLRQKNNNINGIYPNLEENMSSHISLTNLSNLQKSDSYNTLKVKDLVANFNKCTVPSNGISNKDINRSYFPNFPNGTIRLSPKKCLSEYNLTCVKRRSSFK